MATPYVGIYASSYPAYDSGTTTPPVPVSPAITSFSPTGGVQGSTVTITGNAFTGATLVSINSATVASFTVDSATQITAVLSNSQATGKVRVTTPAGTATSASDFVVAAGNGGLVHYAIPELARVDTGSAETGIDGNPIRATFSTVSFSSAASQVQLDLSSSLGQAGNYAAVIAAYVNGVYQRVDFPNDGSRALVDLRGIPAGLNTYEIVLNDQGRLALDTNQLVGTTLWGIKANGAVTFVNAVVPDSVYLWVGDSFLGGGGCTNPMTDGLTTLNRNRLKGAARVRVQSVSGGCLLETYGPTMDRAAYLARTKSVLNGRTKNVLIVQDGTNAAGRGNRTAAAYGATYAQYLADVKAAGITNLEIVCITPTYAPTYDPKLEQFRAQIRIAATNIGARLIEGSGLVSAADLNSNNDVHPTSAGHAKYEANFWAKYTSSTPAGVYVVTNNGDGTTPPEEIYRVASLTGPQHVIRATSAAPLGSFANYKSVELFDSSIPSASSAVPAPGNTVLLFDNQGTNLRFSFGWVRLGDGTAYLEGPGWYEFDVPAGVVGYRIINTRQPNTPGLYVSDNGSTGSNANPVLTESDFTFTGPWQGLGTSVVYLDDQPGAVTFSIPTGFTGFKIETTKQPNTPGFTLTYDGANTGTFYATTGSGDGTVYEIVQDATIGAGHTVTLTHSGDMAMNLPRVTRLA